MTSEFDFVSDKNKEKHGYIFEWRRLGSGALYAVKFTLNPEDRGALPPSLQRHWLSPVEFNMTIDELKLAYPLKV